MYGIWIFGIEIDLVLVWKVYEHGFKMAKNVIMV